MVYKNASLPRTIDCNYNQLITTHFINSLLQFDHTHTSLNFKRQPIHTRKMDGVYGKHSRHIVAFQNYIIIQYTDM